MCSRSSRKGVVPIPLQNEGVSQSDGVVAPTIGGGGVDIPLQIEGVSQSDGVVAPTTGGGGVVPE